MAYICNVTFIIAPSQKGDFLSWLREKAPSELFGEGSTATDPRLQLVVETGGEKPGQDHGVSVALSSRFETEDDAHVWGDTYLVPFLNGFHSTFGSQALFFVTLMELLEL